MDPRKVSGRITATIIKAKGLVFPKPEPGHEKDRLNAYCSIGIAGTESNSRAFTRTIQDTNSPTWDQNVYSPFCYVELEVASEGRSQPLGKVLIDLVFLADQAAHQEWYKLGQECRVGEPPRLPAQTKGEVLVKLQYKYGPEWETLYQGPLAIVQKSNALATRAITDALTSFPSEARLYGYRCQAYMEMKNWKQALDDAYALVDAYPTSSEGYHKVATVYARGGEVELALQVFNQGLKINPKDEQIAAELDIIRRQKIKEALDGKVAFANKEFKEAAALFTQAIEANPKNSTYLVFRATTYLHLKNYNDINKLLDITPEWPKTNARKEGWLSKSGKINISLKRRWMVLKECFLFYYKTPDGSGRPKGIVGLADGDLKYAGPTRRFQVTVAGLGRTFKFEAESIEEGMSWISALEEVNKRGPLLQPTVSVFGEAQRHRSMVRIVSGGGKSEVQGAPHPNGVGAAGNRKSVTVPPPPSSAPPPPPGGPPVKFVEVVEDETGKLTAPPLTVDDVEKRARMGVTAMSSSESKYFKRFGLQPPVEKSGGSLSLNGEPVSPGSAPHEATPLLPPTPVKPKQEGCCASCVIS